MFILTKRIVPLAIASTLFCATALANEGVYFAADVAKSTSTMKKDYGQNAYKKMPFYYNLSAGYKLNENLFTEFSYEFTTGQKRTNRISAGDYLPGRILQNPGEFDVLKTQLNLQHPTLYLGYKFDLSDHISNLDVSLAAGLSWSTLKAKQEILENELGVLNQAAIDASRRVFNSRRMIPTIKATANYKMSDRFGIRCTANWRQLSRFKQKSLENPTSNTQIKLKSTMAFGVGFTYSV